MRTIGIYDCCNSSNPITSFIFTCYTSMNSCFILFVFHNQFLRLKMKDCEIANSCLLVAMLPICGIDYEKLAMISQDQCIDSSHLLQWKYYQNSPSDQSWNFARQIKSWVYPILSISLWHPVYHIQHQSFCRCHLKIIFCRTHKRIYVGR